MNMIQDRDTGDECQCADCQPVVRFRNMKYQPLPVIRIYPALPGQMRIVRFDPIPRGNQLMLVPVWRYVDNG